MATVFRDISWNSNRMMTTSSITVKIFNRMSDDFVAWLKNSAQFPPPQPPQRRFMHPKIIAYIQLISHVTPIYIHHSHLN